MGKMVTIIVRDGGQSRAVPLTVNGRRVSLPVGKRKEIDEDHLPALRDSHVKFDVVAEAVPEAVEDPEPTNSLLAILDLSIDKIAPAIQGLGPDDLKALLTAETAGKTRKGVVELLNQALGA